MSIKISSTLLGTIFVAFKTLFQGALGQAPSQWKKFATLVPSTTASNTYGWLGKLPGMREWLGDRVVHGLQAHDYSVKNKKFELTIGVPRESIEDDQYGVFSPMFQHMGEATGAHPDELVFGAIKTGHSNVCYDGQNFFDTDHPVLDQNGATTTQANLDDNSGTGTRWFLLKNNAAIKPIIFQQRKAPEFVAKDNPTDENVFNKSEFVYGVDGRDNVGYSLWQLAYCSRKDLTEANLLAAWTAMCERKGDYGRPLGIVPDTLLVPPSLYHTALKLVSATTLANGADNVMKGMVTVEQSPWLV